VVAEVRGFDRVVVERAREGTGHHPAQPAPGILRGQVRSTPVIQYCPSDSLVTVIPT
jgi:hypothetical protein